MSDEFVTIASYGNTVEAYLAKTLLESQGIKCILEHEDINSIFTGIFYIELKVHETDLDEARKILENEGNRFDS